MKNEITVLDSCDSNDDEKLMAILMILSRSDEDEDLDT